MHTDVETGGADIRGHAPFSLVTKPIGPRCNLDCRYCYYLEKETLYPGRKRWRMSDDQLENYIKQYIECQATPVVTFAWHGGEPTLAGLEFFERVVALQRKYCPRDTRIENAFQTNGTLLDDAWCAFLAENDFLVGLSLDGPRRLHDEYRRTRAGKPSFDRVMQALALLRRHNVAYNVLTVVSRANAGRGRQVYRFLKRHGVQYMQFIPLVERRDAAGQPVSLPVAEGVDAAVTPWSVRPAEFGRFLCAVFDEWVKSDVGRIFVRMFDMQVSVRMNMPPTLCHFAETCGDGLALEHNGDLYACDHYVYPDYRLGNIFETPLAELARSPEQRRFGLAKRDALPGRCADCRYLAVCNGGCPKHRFVTPRDGGETANYLCPGYKRFFAHSAEAFDLMAELLRRGRPASDAMALLN